MKGYETIFILHPNLTDEGQKPLLEKFKGIVESNGGKLVSQSTWGKRKLAYLVKKQAYGHYHMFYLDRTPKALKELETQFGYNDEVLLWQTTAVDDVVAEQTNFELLKTEGSLAQKISER